GFGELEDHWVQLLGVPARQGREIADSEREAGCPEVEEVLDGVGEADLDRVDVGSEHGLEELRSRLDAGCYVARHWSPAEVRGVAPPRAAHRWFGQRAFNLFRPQRRQCERLARIRPGGHRQQQRRIGHRPGQWPYGAHRVEWLVVAAARDT